MALLDIAAKGWVITYMLCGAYGGIGTLELNNGNLFGFSLGVMSDYQWRNSCVLDSIFLFGVYTYIII